VSTCANGFGNCDGRGDNGCETDVTSSLEHCGGCNRACRAPANGTASCEARSCVTRCDAGFNKCGSQCVADSPTSCGASCTRCPVPANATAICTRGTCDYTCNTAPFTRKCAAGCCLPKPVVVDVTAGDGFTCALTSLGDVWCWGANGWGQLGVTGGARSTPVLAQAAGGNVSTLASSALHTCAVVAGGVRCWGRSTTTSHISAPKWEPDQPTPRVDLDLRSVQSGVRSVGAGLHHSCALMQDGSVRCWGGNESGQLGNGTREPSGVPVTVQGIIGASALYVGGAHSCALVDGSLRCWGGNGTNGLLGNGSTEPALTPITVPGGQSNVRGGWAGYHTSCAIIDGALRCWGANDRGQLGNNTTSIRSTLQPVDVVGLRGVTEVRTNRERSCAIADGGVFCWGSNGSGNAGILGNASARFPQRTPLVVTGIPSGSGATRLATGFYHSCAVIGGNVKCWGYNGNGELGNGTTQDSTTPVDVEWP
jgi:alpha-tubulin suppressor-like RCC1 family protein